MNDKNDKPIAVLLIEDNPGDVRLIREMLREAGAAQFELACADQLSTGLNHLAAGEVDAVLLDLGLPDSTGIDTFTKVYTQALQVPILVLTGLDDEALAVQAVQQGAQDYLVKGQVDGNLLVRAMRYAIERKRTERVLQRSKREWETTFDAMSDWVSLLDLEARILRSNRVGEEVVGMPLTEVVGQTCCKLVHGSERPIPGCPLQKMLQTHQRESAELQVPDEDRWLMVTVDPVMGENGNLVGAVHIVRDITERRRAAEEIRGLARFPSENPNPVLRVGKDGTVLYANEASPSLLNVWGCQVSQLLPDYWREFILDVLSSGSSKITEVKVEDRVLSLTFAPVVDTGYVNIYGLDITERKRAEEGVQRHLEQIEALREIDRAIISTLDLAEVLDIILEELERVIPYHSVAIFLLSDGTAKVAAARGHPDVARALGVSFRVQDDALVAELMQGKRPLVLADAQADERFLARGATGYVRSWIGVPLIAKGKAVGFLTIDHREPGVYGEESVEIAEAFAGQVAIAIENARLYEEAQRELAERKRAEEGLRQSYGQLQRTLEGTVNVLVSTIEMKDPYTAGHQRRATQLACAIARVVGLAEEQVEGIRMAGLIHDIGKITVPAEILSKPGQLNDLEWGMIKAHPQVGYDILKTVEFPWPVAQIVLQHHERMDGSGYPEGLSAEEIIVEARILGVADVIEAMASFRPYRPARGLDKALEEISQNRGILYDPEVVDVCLKVFTEDRFKFE